MTAAELQQLDRTEDAVQPGAPLISDESANVRSFAQRSKPSSTSQVAERRRAGKVPVPPPAPSPPSISSRRSPPPPHNPINPEPLRTMTTKGIDPQSQWLFTEEEIRNSPSGLDGLPIAEEICRRAKGVNFIIQVGILLKIPQTTLGTAATFFHRFYTRYSMVTEKGGIHHYNIAATALFLATKAEETCRKTKEIVIAVVKIAQKNASLIIDEQSKEFWRWKDSILLYEETMLELLTFDVVLESPYNCLHDFIREFQIDTHKAMRNVSWAFLNDSCMTTLCLLMPPRDIAVASLYFAAKFNNERLPDGQDGSPWWIRLNGDPERIIKAIDVMSDFYTENPLKKSDNPYDRSPGSSPEDLDRTRLRAGSHSPVFEQTAEHPEIEENHTDDLTNGRIEENSLKGEEVDDKEIDHEAGDDDAKLKAIANDPETHEPHENGVANGFVALEGKRKEKTEKVDEPEAKRMKVETEQDESEEGEVEE